MDVFAPCALGSVLNGAPISTLKCRLIAGAANNQLSSTADAQGLHERGVHYLPGYVVNAGDIISCAREYEGTGDSAGVEHEVQRIADRVSDLIEKSRATGKSIAEVAYAQARARIGFPVQGNQ